jgi:hypothetical protein
MVHALSLGVVSTISAKAGVTMGAPFGNIISYVDGPCAQSTGIPYFYVSPLDQSAKDASIRPQVSLTLSESFLPATCHAFGQTAACAATTHGDPENPVCARLVISGEWVVVDPSHDASVHAWAQEALFERHPAMVAWPVDHDWKIIKLQISDLWFIDYFGGAYELDLGDYLDYHLSPGNDSSSLGYV